MKLYPTKLSCLITFVLALYFNEELEETILKCDNYVACFDESLNRVAQCGQMDLVVHYYWHKEKNIIETRYLKSVFMNGSTAEDILHSFEEGLKHLKKSKLIQVSMDGPNVN
ncbi:hypothetical protein NQ314_009458 [Rhamnusium bicolor]|uniref:Uncharacterized protein n=1 Tax=Rhamnusium bicolor TaxID=1586634 RepID=A0AAV8Y1Z2_9CUCU|nr:hypothetical protein NQ314_009458 [Rhamnusium bicolor]